MTLQAPKRIRRPRCTLTGVPVQRGDAVMLVGHDATHPVMERVRYLRKQQTRLEPTGDVLSAPVTLHRHTTEGVGLEYAVMMAKYLSAALDALSLAERLALIAWWDSEYGVRRVWRGLCERYSEADANEIIAAVVAVHREQADPDEIGPRLGHDGQWIRDRVRYCQWYANRRGHVNAQPDERRDERG